MCCHLCEQVRDLYSVLTLGDGVPMKDHVYIGTPETSIGLPDGQSKDDVLAAEEMPRVLMGGCCGDPGTEVLFVRLNIRNNKELLRLHSLDNTNDEHI